MLGAELHNSSLSSPTYMRDIWPRLKQMHVNTVLGGVSWETFEPVEGEFDVQALDQVILDAREFGFKMVLLWFGSFKNAMSTYVPGWVKRDVRRFPRVHILDQNTDEGGGGKKRLKTVELISPFCERCWEADARAFGALMSHLKDIDREHQTVVMVQVENEPGLLGDCRDRSSWAERRWKEPVPEDLLRHILSNLDEQRLHSKFSGYLDRVRGLVSQSRRLSWSEAFGNEVAGREMFMADVFSRYVQKVAGAGKKQWPIPMYTNAWLNVDAESLDLQGAPTVAGGGGEPGVYPSGGPIPHTIPIWKYNAPALDFISPDIYLHDYEKLCRYYRLANQPLFIPEQRRDEKGARRVWLAYCTHLAMGCSPFGIDSLLPENSPIARHYSLLGQLSAQVLKAQAERPGDIMGFFFDEFDKANIDPRKESFQRTFGDFDLTVQRAFVFGKPGPGAGMVIHQGNGTFLLAGWGFQVAFKSTSTRSTFSGILRFEEKSVGPDGLLQTERILNGDETRSGACCVMPNDDPDYGGFPIAITIPARTGIAECTVYSIEEGEEDY